MNENKPAVDKVVKRPRMSKKLVDSAYKEHEARMTHVLVWTKKAKDKFVRAPWKITRFLRRNPLPAFVHA